MPTSPLPNCSVPVLPPPPLVAIVVVLLSSLPQAARKAASAVEPPVTASSLRRDTGSLVTRSSALGLFATAMLPPKSRGGSLTPPTGGARCWISESGGGAGADALERAGDAGDALGNPLWRHAGEREPQAVGAAVDHEVGAGDEGDALALGLGQQGAGVSALGEVEPKEVAAAG